MKINKIFLDLDGVLRDWIGGIYKLFDVEAIENKNYDTLVGYVCREYGISKNYFWEKQDHNFWANLNFYPYAGEILDSLPFEKVCILTSPSMTAAGGTQEWIRTHLSKFFNAKQYLIGPAKQFCASPDALLIDDYDLHYQNFTADGGNAILFPQPWNANRNMINSMGRIEFLKTMLEKYEVKYAK